MIDRADREAFHQMVMFRGAAMVKRLRELTTSDRMKVMLEASQISLVNELHLYPFDKKRFVVVSWDPNPLTGAQVIGLIVFGMWVHVGELEEAAGSLLSDWPEILQAKALGYLELDYG